MVPHFSAGLKRVHEGWDCAGPYVTSTNQDGDCSPGLKGEFGSKLR